MADRIEARANFIRKKQQNQGTAQTVTLTTPASQVPNPTVAAESETTSISPGENDRNCVHPQGDEVDRGS